MLTLERPACVRSEGKAGVRDMVQTQKAMQELQEALDTGLKRPPWCSLAQALSWPLRGHKHCRRCCAKVRQCAAQGSMSSCSS